MENLGGLTPEAARAGARRNLLVLAAGMAALYGMVELSAAAATLTFEEAGGSEALAGFAPAIFLAAAAITALPAGGGMDRLGRRPVLLIGFAVGILGSLAAAAGTSSGMLVLTLVGFALTGAAAQVVLLGRTAAADMHPPAERPRAIAIVLFGAVFGALLGPAIFIPLIESSSGGDALAAAWLGAAGFMLAGFVIASRLSPDPLRIAAALRLGSADGAPARPLRRLMTLPGVPAALLAALASWSSMVAVMTLTGAAMVDHGHSQSSVFPVVAAHFVGMFGLFAVVGRIIERLGRDRALGGGLILLAASSVALAGAIESVPLTALALFGIGLGWNVSYVAATTELTERAAPSERATLLGFSDLLSGAAGAALAIAGGVGLDEAGLASVAVGAAALPVLSAVWILRGGTARRPRPT